MRQVLVRPEKYRVRWRTTNAMERLHEEMRRRERVIRIFSTRHPRSVSGTITGEGNLCKRHRDIST